MGRLDGFSSLGGASLSALEKIKADSVDSTVATLGVTTLKGNITQNTGTATLKALAADSATVGGNITQSTGTSSLKALTCSSLTANTSTNTLYVAAGSDKVGVCTQNPAHRLHVNGDLRVETTSSFSGNVTLATPITAYSSTGITPAQGQIGDSVSYHTASAKTLSGSLQQIMSYTLNRGVGVWLVNGHFQVKIAAGTSLSAITFGLYVGTFGGILVNTVLPANTLAVDLSHYVPFSYVFNNTTGEAVTTTVSLQYSATPTTGSVSTTNATDARYNAMRFVRIA